MGREFDRSVFVGIALLALLVAFNAAVSLWNTRHVHDNSARLAHTHGVVAATAAVRADLREMEAAQRTFLLTGDEASYASFRRAGGEARGGLARLKEMTAPSAGQQARVTAVGDALDRTARQLEATVEVRRREGAGAAGLVVAGGTSRRLLDETERLVNEVDGAERELLADRAAASDRAYSNALLFGTAAAAFGLVAVGLFVGVLRRSTRTRAAAAAAVRREREWLHTTLSSIGDAVIATDAVGRVTFLNPVAEALTGWPQAEAAGRPLAEVFRIVNETSRKEVENPALRALREGTVVGLANHTVLIARDGAERPIDDSAAPIRDEAGAVGGAVLVFRDISERKKAEEDRARLAAIVESSDDAIVGKTLDGVIRYWNAGAERIFGYAAAEAIGRPITLIIPPERLGEEREIIERLRRGERIDHFETERVTRGGRRVDVSLTVSPIRDDEGHVVGASKVARDVTERRRADEALRASEARYRAIVEATPECVKLVGPDGTLLQMNRAGLAMVEGDETALGQCVYSVIAPEDRDRFVAFNERVCRGERGELEFDIIGLRGTRRHMETTAVPLPAPLGGFTQLAVTRDVTERKRATEALRAERERSEFVRRASGVGFWYCDLPFDVLEWDERVKAHFWLPPDARVTIGTFYDRIHPDDREPTRAAIEKSIADRAGYDTAYRTVDPDTGAVKWVRAIGRTFCDQNGMPWRFDGVTLDVTEQRRAEAALRESEERFRRALDVRTVGVLFFTLDGTVTDANAAFERMSGYTRDELAGVSHWEALTRPEHWEATARAAADLAERGEAEPYEKEMVRKDGTRWWGLFAPTRLSGTGAGSRCVEFVVEVTARKAAEAAVRASDARNRFLLDLEAATRPLTDPAAITSTASRVLGERLRANRVAYFEIAGPEYVVERDYFNGVESLAGRYSIASFGAALVATFTAGRTVVEADATTQPGRPEGERAAFAAIHVRGHVDVPLVKGGAFVAGMTVHSRDPREWTADEVALIERTAERTWAAVERARAERAARERDERLQLFLGAAADYAVIISDPDDRATEWLGGAERITGWAAGEALGRSVSLIFTPEDRAAGVPEQEAGKAAETGRADNARWHQRKDGSQFFAEGVTVAIRGPDGALRGFGKVFRDRTDRKRAEDGVRFLADASASLAELVDYESTLRRIANLAVGGFADWCAVDVLEEGARRRLTVTRAEPGEAAAVRALDAPADGVIPHVLRTGEPEVVPDLAAVDPDAAPQGAERITMLRELGVRSYLCVPLVSRGRVIGGMTFLSHSARRRFGPEELRVAQDLAGRVTSAIENAQLYRDLQEQDRRKDEFLATLAHELRNPLAPVRNGVQILRATLPADERAGRALAMMDRQLGHMVHLVDDLMDVARVSSGKVVLRKERVELKAVVDAAVEATRPAVEAAGHELTVALPDEPLAFRADRTRLAQIFANLLNNAAKYTPAGGRIGLTAHRESGAAVVRVTDTGVGIPADMLPKVFDMFTQVGASIERSQGGLGIGLTLVKRLVELHGGRVTAESPGPGRGSTFTVRLPLDPAAPGPAGGPGAEREGAGGRLRVLVVDDNRDAAESLGLVLEMKGHEVRTAFDGPDALRLLGTYRPHLILLDLGLPGMTGFEVARKIRESPALRGVMLVALTGWGQEEDRRRTRAAGFDHHLVKPADPDEIERILSAVGGER